MTKIANIGQLKSPICFVGILDNYETIYMSNTILSYIWNRSGTAPIRKNLIVTCRLWRESIWCRLDTSPAWGSSRHRPKKGFTPYIAYKGTSREWKGLLTQKCIPKTSGRDSKSRLGASRRQGNFRPYWIRKEIHSWGALKLLGINECEFS